MAHYTVVECCVGGGGQALGLEAAGFDCVLAIEIDPNCCTTLRLNRPQWNVRQEDMRLTDGKEFNHVDLFAAGVPCPPFSIAGKQLGTLDDRDMFPHALRLIKEMCPGLGIANQPPEPDFPIDGHPRLTVRMVSVIVMGDKCNVGPTLSAAA